MPATSHSKKVEKEIDVIEEKIEEVVDEATTEIKKTMKKNKIKKSHIMWSFLVLCVIVLGFLMYRQYTHSASYIEKKTTKETQALIKKVSKLMILPASKPSIFKIEDPQVLVKQQAFFKGAEKGDTLLVYPDVSKAIIYSTKRNIIVNVGPVNLAPDAATKIEPKEEEAPLE